MYVYWIIIYYLNKSCTRNLVGNLQNEQKLQFNRDHQVCFWVALTLKIDGGEISFWKQLMSCHYKYWGWQISIFHIFGQEVTHRPLWRLHIWLHAYITADNAEILQNIN